VEQQQGWQNILGVNILVFELNKEYLAIIKRKTIIEEDLFSR
jgi:hypothetical protein